MNYICGFLNSFGGKLFFGINNDGLVKGIGLSRYAGTLTLRSDIDTFQIDLDNSLRRFQPKIFPEQINVKFHEICSDSTRKYLISNRYVVEIDISPPPDPYEVYSNNYSECYIKRSGSLNCLSIPEVM